MTATITALVPENTTEMLSQLARDINEAHVACEAAGAVRHAAGAIRLDHARQAGAMLTQAKAVLSHGDWLPWLAEHCPTISPRQGQRYMRIADQWPALEAKATRVSHLTLRQALALLTEPREAAESADGEGINAHLHGSPAARDLTRRREAGAGEGRREGRGENADRSETFDSSRFVADLVESATTLLTGADDVNFAAIDAERVPAWTEALREAAGQLLAYADRLEREVQR